MIAARLLVLALAAFLTGGTIAEVAHDRAAAEKRRIESLIASVETLEGAVFVRNGKAYEPRKAAAFLRAKWKHQAGEIRTAEQFIEKAATRSSTTGRVYLVRFADGVETPVAAFLRSRLRDAPP